MIGVNAAGLRGTSQQPAQGINFAISARTALPIERTLIQHGQVTRGFMGVGVVNINSQLAQADNLPVDHGAGIRQVSAGSPAQRAGLQSGDIIVKVGNQTINYTGDLTNALATYGPGTKVSISYYRGKSQRTTQITLGSRPVGG